MDPSNLLPGHNIKLEPACEADHIDSSAKHFVTEIPDFDMADSKLPVGIKLEQPEVDVEYPDEDKKTHCSQNATSLSLQEHAQMENMLCGNIDFKLVKQEISNNLYEDKHQLLDKITNYSNEMITVCSNDHETNAHSNLESSMTLNSHQSSQEYNTDFNILENKSTVFEISTKQFLFDGTDKLLKIVGIKSIAIPCMTGVCVDRHRNRQKRKYTREKKPYKCNDCGASFPSPSKLNIHQRKHTGERPYKCDDCGASFHSTSNLREHKRKHTGERPYKCDDCGASFHLISSLNRHMRIHTGERPYKCDDCGASFKSNNNLNRHMRIHTGERPYKCDDCGASFKSISNLNQHKRMHTGDKPFKCNYCGVSFAQVSSLNFHMRKHTGERP